MTGQPPVPTHRVVVRCGDYEGPWCLIYDGRGVEDWNHTWTAPNGEIASYHVEPIH